MSWETWVHCIGKKGSAYDIASKVKENIIKHIEDPNNKINKSITQSKVENAMNFPKLLMTSSQDSIVHNTKSRNMWTPFVKDNFGNDCLSTHDNTKKKHRKIRLGCFSRWKDGKFIPF